MSSTYSRPHAVVCLWEYVPKDKAKPRISKRWNLVESYGIDQDGYACTASKHASKDRMSFMPFMNDKVWWDAEIEMSVKTPPKSKDAQDYEWRPIMGRAATVWNMVGGTSLLDLHPPEWAEWLSGQFVGELKKLQNWHLLIEDGYTLYAGTAVEVQKLWGV